MSVPTPSEPLPRTSRRVRVRWVAVLLVVALTAVAFGARRRPAGQRAVPEGPQAVRTVEADGLQYRYHAVMGRESLFDLADPEPRPDRAAERPQDAARLRSLLLRQAGAESLEDLRTPFSDQIEALRRLGYL